MTDRWKVAVRIAAAMAVVSASALGQGTKGGKPAEPFFHQFLIPGDPLDEKLLAQEKRVAENPNSAALRNDYGNLLAERRFPKEARAEYRKALALDPQFFVAAYNLGMLEETIGRIPEAMSAYREAIDRRRGFPPAHFRLGRLYEKAGGRDGQAIAEYAKAIFINSAMRDPKVNPLVLDSRLMDQASLLNYDRDIARAALVQSAEYVEAARFRPVPVTRPLNTSEVVEEAGPQTIETRKTTPGASGNRAPPLATTPVRPGTGTAIRPMTRPRRDVMPRPATDVAPESPAPAPTPIPAEVPPPAPEPEPEPQPQR